MACSVCGEAGHNKRTCHKGSEPSSSEVASQLNVRNISSQTKKEATTTWTSKSLVPAKVRYHPDIGQASSTIKNKLEVAKDRDKAIEEKQKELIKKLEKIPHPTRPAVEAKPTSCKGCHDQVWDLTPIWLNDEAKLRFRKGPTEKDGPGFIYMYTYLNPKTDDDINLFKIGMSEKEEGRTRIKIQETKNKEKYMTVFHDSTPYRFLTENVIHLHLKRFRDPREQGDGKTEWFRGSKDLLQRVVKDVLKEIRFAVENRTLGAISINSNSSQN